MLGVFFSLPLFLCRYASLRAFEFKQFCHSIVVVACRYRIMTSFFLSLSEEVARHGFTVIVDMRGSKWDSIKPLLKILQESFPSCIHVALIIKPDNFWQKQRTNFGSSKFEFEVGDDIKALICFGVFASNVPIK